MDERGEYHIELKFQNNGEFEHCFTSFGYYENQNSNDSTSISINKGTFELEDNFLVIKNDSRVTMRIFDGEKIIRDTSISRTIIEHQYQ